MPLNDNYPALYLVRDGRDVLVSFTHFLLRTEYGIPVGASREAFLWKLRRLIATNGYFGGWGPHVLAWKRRAAPTSIVRYEELIADPAAALEKALPPLGCALTK